MKTIFPIIIFTAATASAQFTLGIDGPGGFSVRHDDHWDHNGIHTTRPHSVPEPSSPLVMLVSAGLALIGRRHRKGCIRERKVDMRTVRFP
jgi:hypothetical protein